MQMLIPSALQKQRRAAKFSGASGAGRPLLRRALSAFFSLFSAFSSMPAPLLCALGVSCFALRVVGECCELFGVFR